MLNVVEGFGKVESRTPEVIRIIVENNQFI